ncbi:type II CRISPR RNA-guided endonuclease Cas9 [bacterium]|nr:type II CRISPR RNA-guided endonuclease Cas9 [bacterium]
MIFKRKKKKPKKDVLKNGVNPDSKNNLLRYRLWEEQSGKCVYSQRPIDIRRLSEPNYTDIDHIIPYSKSLDDSLNNKVLCLSDENRQKGNKIPYDYLSSKINWEEYVSWIRSLNLPKAKTSRLTRTTYSDEKGFISRNLNDTRYITIFIKDYLKSYLDFGKNFKIETRNGSLTAFLRNQWGLDKNRAENDKHHALDAIVLACSTQGMVKYLSTISAKRENYDFINNSKPKFKTPWETFRQDVDEALSNIFVSRMLSAKIPGGIHEATYRSPKYINEGFTTLKTDIHTIDLKKLELLFDKERNYKVYDILKSRLEQANNDPKIAFKEPVYMPLSKEKQEKGIKPHPIKTVKLKDNSISGIVLPQGFAKNDSMPRVDVFTKKNKKGKVEFYLVPIYVADFAKGILPNRAITCNKSQQDWTEIDDTFEFQFSLFKNTPVLINKTGKPEDDKFYYYKSTDIDSGRIVVINIDNSNSDTKIRFSVKGLEKFKKYQVDVLGKYSEVKQEKRQNISLKDK